MNPPPDGASPDGEAPTEADPGADAPSGEAPERETPGGEAGREPEPAPEPAPPAPPESEEPRGAGASPWAAGMAARRSVSPSPGTTDTAAPDDQPPELPSPLRLLGASLDLAFRASTRLRGASIWVALQTLGIVGPVVVLTLTALSRHPEIFDAFQRGGGTVDPAVANIAATIGLGASIAVLGLVVLSLESQLVSVALLGGQAIGRPVSLHEAIGRSRQTFWRLVRVSILVQVPLSLIGQGVSVLLEQPLHGTEAVLLVAAAVTTVLGAPFAYVAAGIVLGDVAALESIRRSVRMARVRWRLALLVSVLARLAQYLLLFGFSAGVDIVARVADQLGLSVGTGSSTVLPALLLVLFAVVAAGSLLLTVSALAAAPEVVAFLGLTHYAAGLDRARESRATGSRSRWLGWGMAIGIAISVLISVAGVAAIGRL